MLFLKQLSILLWKCWIMRRRHYISSFFELVFPLSLAIIFAYHYKTMQESNGTNQMSNNTSAARVPPTIFNSSYSFNYSLNTSSYNNDTNYSMKNCPSHLNKLTSESLDYILYYAPHNQFTASLIDQIQKYCPIKNKPIKTVKEFNSYLNLYQSSNDTSNISYIFGVSFDNEKYWPIPYLSLIHI